jgi:hypothetical protein
VSTHSASSQLQASYTPFRRKRQTTRRYSGEPPRQLAVAVQQSSTMERTH